MFSFLQPYSSSEKESEKEPEDTPDVNKHTSDATSISSFGFMNQDSGDVPADGDSSFSFMQQDSASVAVSTGFSFMSNVTSTEDSSAECPSSFSFMSNDHVEMPAPVPSVDHETHLATLLSLSHPVVSGVTESTGLGQANDLLDVKLNKTSVKTVKKKKKSSKVGFGRDDEDDAEDRQLPQQQPSPMVTQQEPQSHFGFMTSGTSAISSIEVDAGMEHDVGLSGESLEGAHVPDLSPLSVRTDLPPTPPPPPPVHSLSFTSQSSLAVRESDENPALMSEHADHVSATVTERQVASSMPNASFEPEQPAHSPTPMSVANSEPLSGLDKEPSPEPLSALTHVATPPSPKPPLSSPAPFSAQSGALSPVESAVQKLERKSRDIQAQLTNSLNELSRIHSSAVAGQARFRAEIEAEISGIQNARTSMQAAEEEQTRLALEEDFERAEALNEVIRGRDAEVRAREVALGDLRNSVRLLEETFAHERSDCVSSFVRATHSLRVTREQLQVALAQQQSSSERQWELEDSRIRAELERIGLEKGHFEREEQALAGDSDRTEEAIRTQTGDLAAKKVGLEASMDTLAEEIRALQEQLSAKLAAQQVLAADLDMVDGKIGEVRRKYDRQLQRIADRQSALQLSKAECLEEESLVLREQSTLEAAAAERALSKQTAAAWASSLKVDIDIADLLLAELNVPLGNASSTPMASMKPVESAVDDSTSTELRRNLEAISYLLNKKHALTFDLQTQRVDLVGESRRLADLVPVFEAEKKAHAAAKRFKEAAAAAKELKEVQNAKESIDFKIEEIDVAATATAEEIVQLEEQEAATSAALRDARRQGDIARFELLLVRAKEVRAMQRVVASKLNSSEGKGPTSAGGEDIGSKVLFFLAAELEAVQQEALVLKDLHALPQEVFCTNGEEDSSSQSQDIDPFDRDDGDNHQLHADAEVPASGSSNVSAEAVAADGGGENEEDPQPSECAGPEPVSCESIGQDAGQDAGHGGAGEVEESTAAQEAKQQQEEEEEETHRAARMAEAKALVVLIADLSERLDRASEEEEYELAAELFEEVTSNTEKLDEMLLKLQCSKEDL